MLNKKRVYITTAGNLNYFGYHSFRTPGTVFLTDAQIAILAASGVKFQVIEDIPNVPDEPKKRIKKQPEQILEAE